MLTNTPLLELARPSRISPVPSRVCVPFVRKRPNAEPSSPMKAVPFSVNPFSSVIVMLAGSDMSMSALTVTPFNVLLA